MIFLKILEIKTSKTSIYLLVILLGFAKIEAQNKIDIYVISRDNKQPIENAFIYNYTTKQFIYSDQTGIATIGYEKTADSIFISIPRYKEVKTTVEAIQKSDHLMVLCPLFERLKTVFISTEIPGKTCKYVIKSRKKNYIGMISSGGSVVSYHKQKKCGSCELNGIIFFFDNKNLGEKTFIRPLILELKNEKKISLLETPYSILLHPGNDKLIVNLSNAWITLKENHEYLIGFELIDRENKMRKVLFQSTKKKGLYSMIRSSPIKEWFSLQDQAKGFSLNYELLFGGCN